MRVFLTGSTGFIGKAIINFLPQHNYCNFKRGEDIALSLNSFKPDVIIHSAGEIYKTHEMIDSNIILTHNILEYVRDNNVQKMIYIGSSSEYGKKETAMSESHFCDSQSVYAATKTAGTLLCQAYARTYDKDICVLRPFSVYGDYEPEHRLIPTLYKKISSHETVSLIQGTHDFIYIRDFIHLLSTLLESDRLLTKADIINAGTGISYTNFEVANIFSDILNVPLKYELVDTIKDCDSPLWQCDTSYTQRKYKFIPKYTLADGIRTFIMGKCLHHVH